MKKIITGAASAAILISASVVSAQTDAYIKIDGVEGEATTRSESWVTAQPGGASAKGNVETEWKVEEGESARGGQGEQEGEERKGREGKEEPRARQR